MKKLLTILLLLPFVNAIAQDSLITNRGKIVIGGTGISNVATGYGLSGGPITSTGTIVVDSAALSLKYLRLADSSAFVHKATKETITDVKTFDSIQNFRSDINLKGNINHINETTIVDLNSAIATNAPTYLTLPTYDGSGQGVHPDVYYNPNGKFGYEYWMVFEPYPQGRGRFERPSLVASHDGINWVVPSGITNPIVPEPADTVNYSADGDIIEGTDGNLYIFWKNSTTTSTVAPYSFWVKSYNGTTLGTSTKIIDLDSTSAVISPAITFENGKYMMRAVKRGSPYVTPNVIVQRTADSPYGPWSSETTDTLVNVPSGREVWHIDVHKMGDEFHMFAATVAYGVTGANAILYMASSHNGTTWTFTNNPILDKSVSGWDNGYIYRSSAIEVNSPYKKYRLYYSASDASGNWHIGVTDLNFSGTVSSVSGTTNRITSTGGTTPVIDISSTFEGLFPKLASANIFTQNGALSTPANTFKGTWITGGTTTTNKPYMLIEPTGATSTAWNVNGTGLGINSASGFTGNLLDVQLNGVSKFSVNSSGGVITGSSISAGGTIFAGLLANSSSSANSLISLAAAGTQITRNIADANPALYILQSNASSTGDIQQWRNNTGIVTKVNQGGKLQYTVNPTMAAVDSLTIPDKKYVDSVFANVGASVASASTIVPTGNTFHVTGTSTITSITATNVKAGSVITIIFDGILTFTDGSNLKLAGNFTTAADATITLRYDGTNFYEMSRSTN